MNRANKNIVPVDLIARVLSGEADKSERAELDIWIAKSEENKSSYNSYLTLWEKSGKITPVVPISVDDEWAQFKSTTSISSSRRRVSGVFHLYSKIAAAVVLIVVIGSAALFTYNGVKFEKVVASSDIAEITLPDGSQVDLYPGSALKFPKKYSTTSRYVKLDGEAFFQVKKDSLRTFSVSSGDMIVKVLGTSFMVEAFREQTKYNVIVEEGKVAVINSSSTENIVNLLAGEKATFEKSSAEIVKSENIDYNFNAWSSRRIVFVNAGLEEITTTLSKVYLKEISAISESDDQMITVTFENKSLEYVLNTIEATLDIKVTFEGEKIVIK